MRRYILRNRRSNAIEQLYATLGEAIAAAIKLIDAGPDADVIDAQGSGEILVGKFDVREAEGYLLRNLGSEMIDKPTPLSEILQAARKRRKEEKIIFHWDIGSDGEFR
ncbi:MAG: hypothetical protein L0211_26175 [Planctomycetaceae bacterium]|nr:hypothetical protein [Planctomycetaceae bacterium]